MVADPGLTIDLYKSSEAGPQHGSERAGRQFDLIRLFFSFSFAGSGDDGLCDERVEADW
jgi:hypothetical protein